MSPDGTTLASAAWDRTVRLWPLARRRSRVCSKASAERQRRRLHARRQAVVSAGYDLTLRIWPLDGGTPTIVTLPAPLNAVAVAPDGEIVAAGADGQGLLPVAAGELRGEVEAAAVPVIALAVSRDGTLRSPRPASAARSPSSIASIASSRSTLVGPGLPAWSVAFLPDNRTLLTGGADRLIRRWNAVTGEHIGAVAAGRVRPIRLRLTRGDPGAQVFRACVACHTLTPDEGNRAGPDACRHLRPQDRDAARLQFLRRR